MKKFAIIVAGGSGSRMQSEIPKQFLLLGNLPLIMHTLNAFYNSPSKPDIIVVMNVHYHQMWEKLCTTHNFTVPHLLVKAGNTRFQSVKNGLKEIKIQGFVAVHDAVRPLLSSELIEKCFAEAEEFGSSVPVIPCSQSLRKVEGKTTIAVDRNSYFLVQTPQVFSLKLLTKSYKEPFRNEFTDDASVVEFAGNSIHLSEGEENNIKITFPQDLLIAQSLLQLFKS